MNEMDALRIKGSGDCALRACPACRTLPHCECARNRPPWPPAKAPRKPRTPQPMPAQPIASPAPASPAEEARTPDLF